MINQATVILLSREVTERLGFWDGYTEEEKERSSRATKMFWQKLLEAESKQNKGIKNYGNYNRDGNSFTTRRHCSTT